MPAPYSVASRWKVSQVCSVLEGGVVGGQGGWKAVWKRVDEGGGRWRWGEWVD